MRSVYNRIGPYDIHQEIGRGGMAVVFLATDTTTETTTIPVHILFAFFVFLNPFLAVFFAAFLLFYVV